MAECGYCDQEMSTGVGCTLAEYSDFLDNMSRPRIPWDGEQPCVDCYAPPGSLHHPGCDAERCPRCSGQAISCTCTGGD